MQSREAKNVVVRRKVVISIKQSRMEKLGISQYSWGSKGIDKDLEPSQRRHMMSTSSEMSASVKEYPLYCPEKKRIPVLHILMEEIPYYVHIRLLFW